MPTADEALSLTGKRDNLILHGVINPAAASDLMKLPPDEQRAVLRYVMLRQGAQPAWISWIKQLEITANDQRLFDQQEQISAMWEVADSKAPDFYDFLEVQPLGSTLLIDAELEQARLGGMVLKEATTQARDTAYRAIRNSEALQDGADQFYLELRATAVDEDTQTIKEANATLLAVTRGLEVLAQLAKVLGDSREIAATTKAGADRCGWETTATNDAYRKEDLEAHARATCRDAGYGLRDLWLPEAQAIYRIAIAAHRIWKRHVGTGAHQRAATPLRKEDI